MLLTLQSGLYCLAPKAQWMPVHPLVFSTFLYDAFTAHHHLRVKQLGDGEPAGFGQWTYISAPCRLNPLAQMGPECHAVVLASIGHTQRDAARRQALDDLMHHALGHLQSPGAHINHQPQLAVGVHGRPDPVRRALQALDRLVVVDLTGFAVAQQRVQLIKLSLLDVHVAEEIVRKGMQRLRRFHQPLEHRMRIALEDSGGGPNAQSLRQARQHTHDQLHRRLLAMKNGAVMLRKKAVAAKTVELPPGAATGMTIGPQVVQPQPAAIVTIGGGTEVHGGMRIKLRLPSWTCCTEEELIGVGMLFPSVHPASRSETALDHPQGLFQSLAAGKGARQV